MSSAVLRQASFAARAASRSAAFSTSVIARKDFVQDLYIKELKAYKPPVAAKDAHVGVVKNYSLPPTPQVPSLPADLAAELSAYDATEPTLAAATAKATEEVAAGPTGADAFLSFLEADEPKHEAHH